MFYLFLIHEATKDGKKLYHLYSFPKTPFFDHHGYCLFLLHGTFYLFHPTEIIINIRNIECYLTSRLRNPSSPITQSFGQMKITFLTLDKVFNDS